MNMDTIKEIDVKSVMTKSSLPVGGYSVNPYVGCPHACRYCYASFMKRFTGHTEPWGTFLDVKNWKPITNPHKYDGERVVIGSVTVTIRMKKNSTVPEGCSKSCEEAMPRL